MIWGVEGQTGEFIIWSLRIYHLWLIQWYTHPLPGNGTRNNVTSSGGPFILMIKRQHFTQFSNHPTHVHVCMHTHTHTHTHTMCECTDYSNSHQWTSPEKRIIKSKQHPNKNRRKQKTTATKPKNWREAIHSRPCRESHRLPPMTPWRNTPQHSLPPSTPICFLKSLFF